MKHKCVIIGDDYPDSEGILFADIRPPLQEFLKSLKGDIGAECFISFRALNNLMRAYIAKVTSEEINEHRALAQKVQDRFENDSELKPINPDLQGPPSTFGERLSDKIADFGGSWKFIIIFVGVLCLWMAANVYILHNKGFDPYPFILLNLVLSCTAALQAPVIMMSQNRQGIKDRERSEYDFKVNLKAEVEVRLLHEKIDHLLFHQHQNMVELYQMQLDMMQQMQQRFDSAEEEKRKLKRN